MAERFTISIKDEDNIEFVDEMHGDVYDNRSELFQKALTKFRQDYGDALRQLKTEKEENTEFV